MVSEPKTIILTGASRGIGHSTVSFFSDKNWQIITCSREQPPEDCRRDPNWSHHITADLEDSTSLDNFVSEAKELIAEKPLHALVNNAGWSPKSPTQERLGCLNGDLEAWRRVFELNFFAPLRLARGFASSLSNNTHAVWHVHG